MSMLGNSEMPPPPGILGPPRNEMTFMDDGTPGPVLVTKLPRRVSNPFWARILDSVARFFSRICHSVGAVFLRGLSTLVLVAGIIGAVMLQMMGYYYMGVLNINPLIATLLYLPILGALGLLREEVLKNGTSPSGMGASRDSHAVAIAYLVMIIFGFFSVFHPVWLRGENVISGRAMWTCIGGTAWFFFSLLFSSLAYASALNIYRSDAIDRRMREWESRGYVPALAPVSSRDSPYGQSRSPYADYKPAAPSTPLAGPPSETASATSGALSASALGISDALGSGSGAEDVDPYREEAIAAAKVGTDAPSLENVYG